MGTRRAQRNSSVVIPVIFISGWMLLSCGSASRLTSAPLPRPGSLIPPTVEPFTGFHQPASLDAWIDPPLGLAERAPGGGEALDTVVHEKVARLEPDVA